MATEDDYDTQVAPLLLEAANLCKTLGISMVARVQFCPEKYGLTMVEQPDAGVGQKLTTLAAQAHGNFDWLAIEAKRHFGSGNSIFLKLGGAE